jgi:hypothetical protein
LKKEEGDLMIGRPDKNEAVPYYFAYIDQVPGDDAVAILESQLSEIVPALAAISGEKSLHRYAPEKWSIRQVLNHVTDIERTFAFRALWFARGFELPLPSFEQDAAVPAARADEVPWAAQVEEFRNVRLASISLFKNLPPEAWVRTGIASEKRFSVRAIAFILAGHLLHHVKLVRERYL